ncbi:MAG: Holliday junction branch migration protein RuvA [Actinomycetes bacterium]
MIGWIQGEVVSRRDGVVTVNVAGVGYDVIVPQRMLAESLAGEQVTFFIHTSVREDAITLFGFADENERSMFRLLLSTPGVGPSTALGAISTFSVQNLISAIYAEDVTAISTIPGIGKKTAARLVLELAGKLPSLEQRDAGITSPNSTNADLESALRSLGYGVVEIREALGAIEIPADEGQALRLALRQLGTR